MNMTRHQRVYKNVETMLRKIQWLINTVKEVKRSLSTRASTQSLTSAAISISSATQSSSLSLASPLDLIISSHSTAIANNNSGSSSSSHNNSNQQNVCYSNLISQIKQEKLEFDSEIEKSQKQDEFARKTSHSNGSATFNPLCKSVLLLSNTRRSLNRNDTNIRHISPRTKDLDTSRDSSESSSVKMSRVDIVIENLINGETKKEIVSRSEFDLKKISDEYSNQENISKLVASIASVASGLEESALGGCSQRFNGTHGPRLNRSDLYDYNPITNYFSYNKKVEEKKFDEKLINEDKFIRESFNKFDLKVCTVRLHDCMQTDALKGFKAPINLTNELKEKLSLIKLERSSTNTFVNSNQESKLKQSKLNCSFNNKRRSNINRSKRSTKGRSKESSNSQQVNEYEKYELEIGNRKRRRKSTEREVSLTNARNREKCVNLELDPARSNRVIDDDVMSDLKVNAILKMETNSIGQPDEPRVDKQVKAETSFSPPYLSLSLCQNGKENKSRKMLNTRSSISTIKNVLSPNKPPNKRAKSW
jgi:hypothetical protein